MSSVHHIQTDGTVETAASDQGIDVQVDIPAVRYVEYDRRPGLSAGVYTVRAGHDDPQRPHAEDEIYVVVAGDGAIVIAGERHELRVGSMVSVPREVEHSFVDVTADLVLAVVFGPPEGSLR